MLPFYRDQAPLSGVDGSRRIVVGTRVVRNPQIASFVIVAYHTGRDNAKSVYVGSFSNSSGTDFVDGFQRLMQTIVARRDQPAERSYTQKLLTGGVEQIGRKIVEEAHEVVDAAERNGQQAADSGIRLAESTAGEKTTRQHVVYEAADLIYHLWVLLASQNIELDEVQSELDRRSGMSGLDEKARRTDNN